MPPMAKRFLPTQEWSRGERKCIGEYEIVARRIIALSPPRQIVANHKPTQLSPTTKHQSANNPHSPTGPFLRRQESIFYKRQRRSILAATPPMTKRFLPTQEWSKDEQECIGEYKIVARRRGNQSITKHLSPPPSLLSCEIPGALF